MGHLTEAGARHIWRNLPLLLLLLGGALADVYLEEKFDDSWEKRWKKSSWKKKENAAGKFIHTAGKWYGDPEADKGIQTQGDSSFFALTTEIPKTIDNKDKDLVVQFQVKHEQDIDCGGGYLKILPASSGKNIDKFGGETPYLIMFGPDICGYSTRKVHVILPYGGKNHMIKKEIKAESDQLSHVYTLIIKPDNTYQVLTDLKEVASGSLYDDWDMLAPKTIKDPKAKKPEDWDEREEIDDPEDSKPADWDETPPTISDKEAKKPDDWNEDDDGEWEVPSIPNPDYKGDWKAKKIPNPAYKGVWQPPDIPNAEYKHSDSLYHMSNIKYVGFELWQVKSGTIFDNILLTDDASYAEKFAKETWGKSQKQEKEIHDKVKAEEKAKKDKEEAAAREQEDKEKKDTEDDYDDDNDSLEMPDDTDDDKAKDEL